MISLWAVHISDGPLAPPWLVGGYVLAAALAWLGSRRLRDEEIPRIAVMSSAFFVASSLHVPLVGTSVHLLLNGLVGVILGVRATLAIPLALFLQAALLFHGGFTTLGVNTCVMVLPALAAWLVFAGLRKTGWLARPATRWFAGFLLGGLTVLATVALNALVLWFGGEESWPTLVKLVVVAHLPIVGVEALIMAATINFLYKVKPEMLGLNIHAHIESKPAESPAAERQAG